MSDEIPIVKPKKMKEYISKQSKYKMLGTLPSSGLIIGPSGSGKTILLQSLITITNFPLNTFLIVKIN